MLWTVRLFDQKERPDGSSLTGTLGSTWLQMAVDHFHKAFPFTGTLVKKAVTLSQGVSAYSVSADFGISDWIGHYKDGLVLDANLGRVRFRGMSFLLNLNTTEQNKPQVFGLYGPAPTFEVRPTPDKTYTGTLWYYALPVALSASTIPEFPDDQILVEYMEIRYKEWLRVLPKASAEEYLRSKVAEFQANGLTNEAEPDQIEMDPHYYGERTMDRLEWMGPPVV